MRAPFAYLLSACFHGSLLWLIASADDVWLFSYAVRSGGSAAAGAPGGQQIEWLADSEIAAYEPQPSTSVAVAAAAPTEPATPSSIDGRVVLRTGDAASFHRRTTSGRGDPAKSTSPMAHEFRGEPAVEPVEAAAALSTILLSDEGAVIATDTLTAATSPARAPAPSVAVIESDAVSTGGGGTGAAGAQVDQPPSKLPTNPEPIYPEELRRQRIGGTVLLRVVIRPDGSLESVVLEKSSGYTALDESALAAVKQWRFQPARRGAVATRFEAVLPIRFAIRGGTANR